MGAGPWACDDWRLGCVFWEPSACCAPPVRNKQMANACLRGSTAVLFFSAQAVVLSRRAAARSAPDRLGVRLDARVQDDVSRRNRRCEGDEVFGWRSWRFGWLAQGQQCHVVVIHLPSGLHLHLGGSVIHHAFISRTLPLSFNSCPHSFSFFACLSRLELSVGEAVVCLALFHSLYFFAIFALLTTWRGIYPVHTILTLIFTISLFTFKPLTRFDHSL